MRRQADGKESLASERSLMRLAAYNALTSGVEQGPGLARRALGAGLGLIGGLVWGKGAPAPEETCWKTAQGRWVHVGNVKVSSRPTYEHRLLTAGGCDVLRGTPRSQPAAAPQ